MGEVYRAEDLRLGQTVALKFLSERLEHSSAAVARLHQEVRLARQIAHPGVCRVFDIGDAEGRPFLAMEYIDGEDLAALLRRIGRLPVDKGLEIAQQLCAGLAAIHESGILHRDLKPANILIDSRGRARITDFGISALAEEEHEGRTRFGTPAYMAPEQFAGGELTVRTDLYALGLILYEMLTGSPAFPGVDPRESGIRRLQRKPVPPSALVREIDRRTDLALQQCLEIAPADRPASALRLAGSLPGLDPLAAAVAAGETPSPAVVAASPQVGVLSPSVALPLLGLVILLLLGVSLLYRSDRIVNPFRLERPPEVLADRAREVLSRLGYTRIPRARAFWHAFLIENWLYQMNLLTSGELRKAHDLGSNRNGIVFVYRESPNPLAPHGPVISGSDPPFITPGESLVWLSPEGKLLALVAVPDQTMASRPSTPPDWRPLLTAAGLDPKFFTVVEPQGIPPVPVDARAAWRGFLRGLPGISLPIRVEAASFRGMPVHFEVDVEYPGARGPGKIGSPGLLQGLYYFFYMTVGLGGMLLARRHLRLKRGDWIWSSRLAVFIALFVMANSLLLVGWLWSEANEQFWSVSIGRALTQAALVWICYMGLEPILRRRWPSRVVSWSRLLGGGYRDPMVGRDVLVGAVLGVGLHLTFALNVAIPMLSFGAGQIQADYRLISSTYHIMQYVLDSLIGALVKPLCFLVFLLSLKLVLRHEKVAGWVLWLLLSIVLMQSQPLPSTGLTSWCIGLSASALFVFAWTRFGLLTGVVQWLTFYLSRVDVLTADLSAWYATRGLLAVAMVVAIALYGFIVSTAGQPWFRDEVLAD